MRRSVRVRSGSLGAISVRPILTPRPTRLNGFDFGTGNTGIAPNECATGSLSTELIAGDLGAKLVHGRSSSRSVAPRSVTAPVGNVLAVGVVRVVWDAVPDDTEAQRRPPIGRCYEVSEQAELQEVANVSRISVLHLGKYRATVTVLYAPIVGC